MSLSLIIDCDPGNGIPATDVDDGLALALALASAEVRLAAVTVVEGNVEHALGARVARALVDLAGSSVPVFEGRTTAAQEPVDAWRTALTERRRDQLAEQLWRGFQPRLADVVESRDAAEALLDLTAASPGTHTLVALGPMTNVAEAQRRDRRFLGRLRGLVILAGAFTGPIGVREINVAMDPEAADLVLRSGVPTTLLPLDVSRTTWLTPADVEALTTARSALVRYLAATADPWVRWISSKRGWPGANLHDVAAVAAAIQPDLVTTEHHAVAVELTGTLSRSRLVRVPDEAAGPHPAQRWSSRPRVRVVTDIDRAQLSVFVRERLINFGGPT